MRLRILTLVGLALAGLPSSPAAPAPVAAAPAAAEAPRLVLLVAVDQMRYDYLPRFASGFTGGLRKVMREGAVFTNAHLGHYPSVTAVGHSTMLTGAPPALSGIVGNDWYDRGLKRNVTSVEDPGTQLLGAGAGTGSSPHRLRVSTVGDELKMAHPGSRVIGVAHKDRSAVLMVGRMADRALWWDQNTGAFVSSTWYGPELPRWVTAFNAGRPADAWVGKEWRAAGEAGRPGPVLATLPATPGPDYYGHLYNTTFGDDLLVSLAEAALEGEKLGRRGTTDLLALSFSCNDGVGHDKGPHSAEIREITGGTDLALGRLLDAIDRRVGLSRTVVVLTADHGVAPVPEQMAEWKMPGGRFSRADLETAVSGALERAYGPGPWLEGRAGSAVYLNRALIAERGLDPAAVERVTAAGAESVPLVWRAYTRSQLLEGRVPPDPWSRRVLLSFDRERSGDVDVLLEPYWMSSASGTTHGSAYSYDTHIPLVLMGPGIRPGRYDRPVLLNDLAPTLATLLDVETPSGASGQALAEALDPGARALAPAPR
ncbi:MAG TPA: alkaline phosphatase family protein [Vicinamibacteria bacterium]|nr:alkaline phosphatase family protein [Vicinamibacteria bacterium]